MSSIFTVGINVQVGQALQRINQMEKAFESMEAAVNQSTAVISQLERRIQQLEGTSRNSSSALVMMAKQLRMNYSEAQNFSNQLGLTAGQITTAATKLRELQGVGATTVQQFRVLHRELGITKTQFLELTQATKGVSAELKLVAGLAAGAFGAGVLRFFQEGSNISRQFGGAMMQIGVITEATESQIKSLSDEAERLGIITSKSAVEVSQAAIELTKAGFTVDEVRNGLEGIVRASEASGDSMQKMGELIGSTSRVFGLSAKDFGAIADILVTGANKSNASVSSLDESLQQVSAQARAAGIDLKDTVYLIGLMSDVGIKGGKAGTYLSQMLTRLRNASVAAASGNIELMRGSAGMVKALQKLGVQVLDSRGKMLPMVEVLTRLRGAYQRVQDATPGQEALIAKALFGEEGSKAFLPLMNLSIERMQQFRGDLEAAGGAAVTTGEALTSGFGGSVALLQSSLEGLKKTFGDVINPGLEIFNRTAATVLNFFLQMPEPIKVATVAITGLAGAAALVVGGLAGIGLIGQLAGIGLTALGVGAGGASIGMGLLTAATTALTTVLGILFSPVGLVIAGVVGLIALGKAMYDNSAAFKQAVDGGLKLFQKTMEVLGPILDRFINEYLKEMEMMFQDIVIVIEWVSRTLGDLVGGSILAFNESIQIVTRFVQGFGQAWVKSGDTAIKRIKLILNAMGPLGRAILGIGRTVRNGIGGAFNAVVRTVSGALSKMSQAMANWYNSLPAPLKAALNLAAKAVPGTAVVNAAVRALRGEGGATEAPAAGEESFTPGGIPGQVEQVVNGESPGGGSGAAEQAARQQDELANRQNQLADRIKALQEQRDSLLHEQRLSQISQEYDARIRRERGYKAAALETLKELALNQERYQEKLRLIELNHQKTLLELSNMSVAGGGAVGQATAVMSGSKPLTSFPVTSGYGPRWGRFHHGIDHGVPEGTPLSFTQDARVTSAGGFGGRAGNGIMAELANGIAIRILHLQKTPYFRVGDTIPAGTKFGYSGNTGEGSTGPHTHTEIYINGQIINPATRKDLLELIRTGGTPGQRVANQVGQSVNGGGWNTTQASWYGRPDGFHGRRTANGETFNADAMTVASPTLPFGTMVEFEHQGRRVTARVNDRGPFANVNGQATYPLRPHPTRGFDLSEGVARALGTHAAGVANVNYRILGQGGGTSPGMEQGTSIANQIAELERNQALQNLQQGALATFSDPLKNLEEQNYQLEQANALIKEQLELYQFGNGTLQEQIEKAAQLKGIEEERLKLREIYEKIIENPAAFGIITPDALNQLTQSYEQTNEALTRRIALLKESEAIQKQQAERQITDSIRQSQLEEQVAIEERIRALTEGYSEQATYLNTLIQLKQKNVDLTSAEAQATLDAARATDELITRYNQLQQQQQMIQGVSQSVAGSITGAVREVITGASSIEEAIGNLFTNIGTAFLDMALKMVTDMLTQQLMGLFSGLFGGIFGGGGGFSGATLGLLPGLPFAKEGGIIDGPKTGYLAILHGREAVVPLDDAELFASNRTAMKRYSGNGGSVTQQPLPGEMGASANGRTINQSSNHSDTSTYYSTVGGDSSNVTQGASALSSSQISQLFNQNRQTMVTNSRGGLPSDIAIDSDGNIVYGNSSTSSSSLSNTYNRSNSSNIDNSSIAAGGNLNVTLKTTRILDEEFVSAKELPGILAATKKQAAQETLSQLKNSPNVRKKVGI